MTLNEAITNTECLEQSVSADLADDEKEALRLLIEAGKDIKRIRATFPLIDFGLLPGETEE
ncbi:hypothetical protein ES708_29478 [subsurface metagenome]